MKSALIVCMTFLLLPLCSVQAEDRVSVAIPYPIERVDLLNHNEPVNRSVLSNVSSALTRTDSRGVSHLEVATGLRSSEGGKVWTLEIRPGVYTQGEELLTPELLKKTLEVLIEKPQKASTSSVRKLLENIAELEVPQAAAGQEPKFLVFRLAESMDDFPRYLSLLPLPDPIIAKHFGDAFSFGTNPSFVGPYVIRENRKGKGLSLERSKDFYRAGLPRSSAVYFNYYENAAAALRALRVGAVDIVLMPTSWQLEDIVEDETLVSMPSPLLAMAQYTGPWVLPKKYWSNPDQESDRLLVDKIIVRKSLKFEGRARERFDLSTSFLP